MAKDISKMGVQELKALAYDLTTQIQSYQNDLNTVNQRIAHLLAPPVEKEVLATGATDLRPTGPTGPTGPTEEVVKKD